MRGSLFACLVCEPSTSRTTSARDASVSAAEISVPRPLGAVFLTHSHLLQAWEPCRYTKGRSSLGEGRWGKVEVSGRAINPFPSAINLFVCVFTFRIQSRNVLGRWQ